MKDISKKTKIITILIAIVIIIGMIVTLTVGLNFELKYQEAKTIQLYLGKDFEVTDMKQIVNEILPNQTVMIQKVEVYEDTVSILAKDITEEQKTNIINKVNEKYGTELKADNIDISTVPHTRGRDIIKPYIVPFMMATIIILVYMVIRYYKLGMIKAILETIIVILGTQVILLSIIAITRIPIGRITIPMVLVAYILSLLGLTTYFERLLREKKMKEEK